MNEPTVTIEDRMAELASRIHDPDPKERRYASAWLHVLWLLRERAAQSEKDEAG